MQINKTTGVDITQRLCIRLPPKISSLGVLDAHGSFKDGLMSYSMPQLELQLVIMFMVIQSLHFFLKRIGIPKLVTDIMAGIVLGPSMLGSIKEFQEIVFHLTSQETLGTLTVFGYSLYIFLIGVKMDLVMIRSSGRKAITIGICSVIIPLIVVCLLLPLLNPVLRSEKGIPANSLTILAGLLSLTSFPVIASLLVSLNMLSSEVGRLVLSSAMVGDLFSSGLLFIFAIARDGRKAYKMIVFLLGVVFILRPAMNWVVRSTPKGKPVKDIYIYPLFLLILGCGLLSVRWLERSFIFGFYILGLAVPHGPPFGSIVVDKLDYFASDFILPFFLAICGLRANLSKITLDNKFVIVTGVFYIITTVSKVTACLLPSLYNKMLIDDALVVALLMSCKGIVDIASYSFLKDSMLIPEGAYAMLTVLVILTASIWPATVNYLYDPSRKYAGYQTRDIAHLKPNAELKILACIHIPENVTAALNFLSVVSPTKDTRISLYILHLIKLTGQSTPVFISHQIQQKIVSNFQYSENVIIPFTRYEQSNPDSVSVNAFTTISPLISMHEDICTLALDKLTSLVVLPFHRQWYTNGTIELDDKTIRRLNCSVLETAPCSIGILIDHSRTGCSVSDELPDSLNHVVVFFIGGGDDRESLSFAKRIAIDTSCFLTVVHFVEKEASDLNEWDHMLDSEMLKDCKHENVGNGNVVYVEKTVRDGSETASIIRSMITEYDLILVGRRHNVNATQISGLGDWSEFPEMGVLGDLLAAPDLGCKGYVLVVQHQHKIGETTKNIL